MYLSVINNRFERVIQHSFVDLLSVRGYERKENQFYFKSGRIAKLLTIGRDIDHTHYRQVAIFTIHVDIISDDVWELRNPDQTLPVFPFQDFAPSTFDRNLGQFYGKKRGTQWLALDATVPEQVMINYLRDLLQTRILPYLDRFTSVNDIVNEYTRFGPSHTRMRLLAQLGRRDEAYTELKKLLDWRHQKGFRMNMVKVAQKFGII